MEVYLGRASMLLFAWAFYVISNLNKKDNSYRKTIILYEQCLAISCLELMIKALDRNYFGIVVSLIITVIIFKTYSKKIQEWK